MKLIALALLALILAGCASTPTTRTVVQRVEIPIPIKCKVQLPERQESVVLSLPLTATLYEQVQALLIDLENTRLHADRLESALKACTN